jgi:hypothetical protein
MDDLDRLIDDAARQMAQREPSDALAGAVMARVSSRATPFVWSWQQLGGVAAAGVVIAALVMFVGENRPPPSSEAPLQTQGSGLKAHDSKTEHAVDSAMESPRPAVVASKHAESVLVDLNEAGEMADPITFDVIAPAPIEVDFLQVAAAPPIDPVEIASIPIEPISSSND